jgi:hypothetical protein
MSEVYVPYGDDAGKTAVLLLEAAEKSKDYEQEHVRTVEGGFLVDKSIADDAGVDYESDEDDKDDSSVTDDKADDKPAAAKKTTAAKK